MHTGAPSLEGPRPPGPWRMSPRAAGTLEAALGSTWTAGDAARGRRRPATAEQGKVGDARWRPSDARFPAGFPKSRKQCPDPLRSPRGAWCPGHSGQKPLSRETCSQPPGPCGHSRSCSWFTLFFLLLQIQPQKGGAGADSSATPDPPQQHPQAGAGGVRGVREQGLQFRFLIRGGLNEAFLGFSSVRKFAFLQIRKS